jgi:predicted nucleotidyltransferase
MMREIEEIQFISARDKALLLELKQRVRKIVPSGMLLLYGSAARGSSGSESDYDVLILTDSILSRTEQEAIEESIYELELSHGAVISSIVFTKDEWNAPLFSVTPFHERVEHDGVLL